MLKFSDLSKGQKRYVVTVMNLYPKLKTTGTITLKECNDIHNEMFAARASGGTKVGFPIWLITNNKVARGVYSLPLPTDEQLKSYNNKSKSQSQPTAKRSRLESIISESEVLDNELEMFNDILRENGITI